MAKDERNRRMTYLYIDPDGLDFLAKRARVKVHFLCGAEVFVP